MTRNSYDEQIAAAYKASREIPRDGLSDWREAVGRHLRSSAGLTLVDIGAGTGQFATAFADWFGTRVIAVEPSAAMRAQIPIRPAVEVRAGNANTLPVPDDSADAAWLSLVLHHIPDLEGAANEIGRVLRPGAPVLIRQGFSDRLDDGIEMIRWFPETARIAGTFPSLGETCAAFVAAGFEEEAVEPVRETYPGTLSDLLGQLDELRTADTTLRDLSEDEFLRGKARLQRANDAASAAPRTNRLDLLVLRLTKS